ncbi:MAG: hypothetical protein AB1576_12625 [Bacillota bacterium]|jgi:predicted amidophosphoribosyltransferase
MFVELNSLGHIIISPAAEVLENQEEWGPLTRSFGCTFVIDPQNINAWTKSWKQSGKITPRSFHYFPHVKGNIRQVLEQNNMEPHEALYVTWNQQELGEAINTRVSTVLMAERWEAGNVLPDLFVTSVTRLEEELRDYLGGSMPGYFGEITATLVGRDRRPSGLRGRTIGNPPVAIDPDMQPRVKIIALGRYFPTGDDRARKHQYSQRILKSKNTKEPVLAKTLSFALKHVHSGNPFEVVTVVPPRPSGAGCLSGLQQTVREACAQSGMMTLYSPEILTCKKAYPSQKHVPFNKRAENVEGKFKARIVSSANHVVLVDDVLLSGSTCLECTRQILQAGVQYVTVIVFGFDQRVVATNDDIVLPCPNPRCTEGTMSLKFNRSNWEAFWGCSNYTSNNCRATYPWGKGLQLLNSMNRTKDIFIFEDVPF